MWTECSDEMPPDFVVVIAEYKGWWPNRGSGGITDAYCYDGNWFNIPESVTMLRWMHIPEPPDNKLAQYRMI